MTFTSKYLITELQRRINEFSGKNPKAVIRLPQEDQYKWFYYQEFGTENWYPIVASPGKRLVFPGKDGEVVRPEQVNHPPIIPKHYIQNVLPDIIIMIKNIVGNTILSSNYNYAILKSTFIETIMPNVKEIIRSSIASVFRPSREATLEIPAGKLGGGITPAEVYEEVATVVDLSE